MKGGCLFLLLQLLTLACDAWAQPSLSRSGAVVIYDGLLDEDGAFKLWETLRSPGIRELHINCRGGSIEAGINVGHMVFDKGLDVIVTKACLSACANYVFTAGRRKKILPGAMV